MNPTRIKAAENLAEELNRVVNSVEINQTDRNRAVAASQGIAQDHLYAITLLMKNTLYSSSFALLRCLFEAYYRGLWLHYCATDAEVSEFLGGAEPPKNIIARIEATPEFQSGVLSQVKRQGWKAMCAYTHTGGLHLQRWQSADAVEPSFEDAELEECLNFAELFGAMAALEVAGLHIGGGKATAVSTLIKARWP